ncbi:unnamed protein product [Sphagnum jensenii]|uniref:Uncharacterized protein n=1 Tax=Sphagnum jensenii TaxID=128206 RepID=A0ABP1AES2_9BRYO
MLDGESKATIRAKVDTLMVGMAKVESMVDSLVEFKAMLQARQHSKHQELSPKEVVYDTPMSTTQATQHDLIANVLKEMATIFVSFLATLSSTPSTLKLSPSLGVNEANQKTRVESTTPKATMSKCGCHQQRGLRGCCTSIYKCDVAKDAIGQVQGPISMSNVQDQVGSVDVIETIIEPSAEACCH